MQRLPKGETEYFCGGIILSSTKILTGIQIIRNKKFLTLILLIVNVAGHCIYPKGGLQKLERDIQILVGMFNLKNFHEDGRFTTAPQNIHLHPKWNPHVRKYIADLAILEPEERLTFNRFVSPICLWDSDEEPSASLGTVAGYGKAEDLNKNYENLP